MHNDYCLSSAESLARHGHTRGNWKCWIDCLMSIYLSNEYHNTKDSIYRMLSIPIANFITISLPLTLIVDVYKGVSCLNNVPLWRKEAVSARLPGNPFVPQSVDVLTDLDFLVTCQRIGPFFWYFVIGSSTDWILIIWAWVVSFSLSPLNLSTKNVRQSYFWICVTPDSRIGRTGFSALKIGWIYCSNRITPGKLLVACMQT